MNSFLQKFNRLARTVDYGASPPEFIKSIMKIVKFVKLWNTRFFSKREIKLEVIVIQTIEGQQTITILENEEDLKFSSFLADLHTKNRRGLVHDTKFGIFIFDTQMELEEFENNKKMSFSFLSESKEAQQIDAELEDEMDMKALRE